MVQTIACFNNILVYSDYINEKFNASNTCFNLTLRTSRKCRLSGSYEDCPPGSNLGGKMFDSDICKKKDGPPLKTYESEYEAQEAIEYVKRQYGNEQVSYKCSRCGYWHLSPKERQTPNHISYCLDSNGKTKQAYPTYEAAKRRAEIIFDEKGIELFVYHCDHCDQCNEYHLTHNQY